MTDPKVVDLATKKIEAEWIKAADRFWLSATPELFKWLGWVAALAALTYVSQKSDAWVVKALLGFYYVAMFFYLNAYFFQFKFANPPFVKSPKCRHLLSLVLSGIIAGAVGWLACEAISGITSAKP